LGDDPGLTELTDDCWKIASRMMRDTPVAELDALTATVDERDFETVAQHVREAIEKNQPEAALDRLHTFVIKYVRTLCEQRGVEVNRDKALHSIFGEYVKRLRDAGHLESLMTERILKSSISVLEAFSDVRNNKSLAHDNPILNYEESLLIFNHVASSIRFIKSLKVQTKHPTTPKLIAAFDEDLPFLFVSIDIWRNDNIYCAVNLVDIVDQSRSSWRCRRLARGRCPAPRAESWPSGFDP
jgi:hypothetical protein